MLWAFFDESGKLANSDFICLCGYICDDGWDDFSKDWKKLLLRHNLPLIHLAKLMRKAPPFDNLGWTDDQRDIVLGQFVKPVRDHLLAGFGVGLDAKYYRSMPAKKRKVIGENDAQDFAFYRLMRLVIDQLKAWNLTDPISINFDYTEDFSVKCIQSLAKLRVEDRRLRRSSAASVLPTIKCITPSKLPTCSPMERIAPYAPSSRDISMPW